MHSPSTDEIPPDCLSAAMECTLHTVERREQGRAIQSFGQLNMRILHETGSRRLPEIDLCINTSAAARRRSCPLSLFRAAVSPLYFPSRGASVLSNS